MHTFTFPGVQDIFKIKQLRQQGLGFESTSQLAVCVFLCGVLHSPCVCLGFTQVLMLPPTVQAQ